jgi:hypothetical protein
MDLYGATSLPTLLFTRDDGYVLVSIARRGQFKNLAALDGQVGEDSGCWVYVRAVPRRSGWFYVIRVKGKPIQFFQRPDVAPDPA